MSKAGTRVLIGLGGVMVGVYLAPFALVTGSVTLVGRGIKGVPDFELDSLEAVRGVLLFVMGVALVFLFKLFFDVLLLGFTL